MINFPFNPSNLRILVSPSCPVKSCNLSSKHIANDKSVDVIIVWIKSLFFK